MRTNVENVNLRLKLGFIEKLKTLITSEICQNFHNFIAFHEVDYSNIKKSVEKF